MVCNTDCRVFKWAVQNQKRFLPKNQYTQKKLLNFENLCSGELSKIEHHFSNKVTLKIGVIKKCQ